MELFRSICRSVFRPQMIIRDFHLKPQRKTGGGLNFHRSNRAKRGLFHGKDVRSGFTISHSHARSKRLFKPNVISKRLFSDALDAWIPFQMTTAALRGVDVSGGIDNYLLSLDNPTVEQSNYITKVRGLVGSALFHRGLLTDKLIRKFKYHQLPPPINAPLSEKEKDGRGFDKEVKLGWRARKELKRRNFNYRGQPNR